MASVQMARRVLGGLHGVSKDPKQTAESGLLEFGHARELVLLMTTIGAGRAHCSGDSNSVVRQAPGVAGGLCLQRMTPRMSYETHPLNDFDFLAGLIQQDIRVLRIIEFLGMAPNAEQRRSVWPEVWKVLVEAVPDLSAWDRAHDLLWGWAQNVKRASVLSLESRRRLSQRFGPCW